MSVEDAAQAYGQFIKDSRDKLSLSQLEFSEKLGVGRSKIVTIEAGKSNTIDLEMLRRLGDSVGSSIADLLLAIALAVPGETSEQMVLGVEEAFVSEEQRKLAIALAEVAALSEDVEVAAQIIPLLGFLVAGDAKEELSPAGYSRINEAYLAMVRRFGALLSEPSSPRNP